MSEPTSSAARAPSLSATLSFLVALSLCGALLGVGRAAAGDTPAGSGSAAATSDAAAPEASKIPEPVTVRLRDLADDAGFTFRHQSAPEKKYILESMSGGVALFDADGDDRLDIYLVNALTVATALEPTSSSSGLYLNRSTADGWRFEDVAKRAGVAHPGWGMGVCVADVDGDGRQDLYVTAVGPNRLYRNRGDGTFEDLAPEAGVTAGGWSAGCGFADYDRDGDLDLFVSRYVEIDLANLPEFGKGKSCQYRGIAVQCGPRGLPGTPDLLYRNDSEGGRLRFTDVSKAAGVDDPDGYFGLGVAWFDADGDGWLDLYVANDSTPNFLYLNQKDGRFEEAAFPLGVAVSEDGAEQGGMGVALGDYDGDGRFDLFVSNFAEEYNALYRNEGAYFTDVSFRSGVAAPSLPYVGWGTAFFDHDNDGWQDLIVVDGHVYPQLSNAKLGASAPYRQRRLMFRNLGNGRFEEVAAEAGEVLTAVRVSRGLALGDLDDDGRLDLVINDLDGGPQVLRNEAEGAGNWLAVRLRGRAPNTDAIGAEIRVTAGKRVQKRLVRSGTSYISQNDMRQHFGLGTVDRVESVEVLWPDGTTTKVTGVVAGQTLVVPQPD